jgi:sortase B
MPFVFDETKILAEYKPIYEKNHDMVGWLKIDGTPIDYPILQRVDEEYYLTHDFFQKKNANGQLILDAACDPYAPSLNLVISGHNMKSGKMFGNLQSYASERFARKHPFIEFDTLFRRGRYLVVTAFYTWDHEAREDGLRYNVDIRYSRQLGTFLDQLEPLKLYDTGAEIEFGDELLMLSTCSYQTADGRFVVIARRIRPGEKY